MILVILYLPHPSAYTNSMTLEFPKLRPGLAAGADEQDPLHIYLWDQSRLAPGHVTPK